MIKSKIMELLFLILFAVGLFASLTFLRKWADSFIMIAFAIGCICCANIYTAQSYGFKVGEITFAIDSVLYTMFLYTVSVKYLHYSKKDSTLFVYSSIVAIIISAVIEFFANVIPHGYDLIYLQRFLSYLASAFATLIATMVLRLIFRELLKKGWHRYSILPLAILVGALVNSILYFGISFFIYGATAFEHHLSILTGNAIMKVICVGLAELSYVLNNDKIWSVKELKFENDERGPYQKDRG